MTTVFDLATLNGRNGFKVANAGNGVSNAGDVNGDGFGDIVIGGNASDNNGNQYFTNYVVFGKSSSFNAVFDPSTLNGGNGFQVRASYSNFATTAGDFNGDGFDDVLVNGHTYSNISAYIVLGKASGFSANTEDIFSIPADKDSLIKIDTVGMGSGNESDFFQVRSAGDVNGDGIDDVIIGYNGGAYNGVSKIVFGQSVFSSGYFPALDGTNGFFVKGTGDDSAGLGGDALGASVSGVGDMNGDGFDDVIIGSPYEFWTTSSNTKGSSYVIFGKASAFDVTVNPADLDGSNGFRLDGVADKDFSGNSVSNAGDVNGDGFDDLIIGAPDADIHGYDSGSSYVVFGKSSGFDAAFDLADLDGSNGFRLDGLAERDYLGSSVSNAGDVNGDGFSDVLISASGADNHGTDSGSVYVVFGKSTGFTGVLDLANLASNAGFRIDGQNAGDRLGSTNTGDAVSAAGDINKDGFSDLMVASMSSQTSYVIFGRSDFANTETEKLIKGTHKSDKLIGTAAAERFEAGNGNDTMIGRGGADSYLGGNGNDYIRVSDLNFKLVDGGRGSDTLGIAAVDANLDLANFSGKIKGIEKINLYGSSGSDNGLTLNKIQLKALSNTTNKLIVEGNTGDYVHVTDDGWHDKGIHNGYHTYTNADAQLLVGVNVAVDFGLIVA
ncbi:hypothetical protein W03_22210 [Nitrosomonas sp. PY1]|uniref:integrin alpha n=1 Tax=Nitrosomonas sp. PY1 TaxID=1803906 RepID=UPI001FC8043B|nr:integrin alpha [Nitrosomonas sp. PY1]GKS70217.1 hypothetical protein W03_22210 [Nitrosomonas sp. PY1]